MSPGGADPADVDERPDDRAHHLPAERLGADVVAQTPSPRSTHDDSSTRRVVVDPSGPFRQNDDEVVLADERVGAESQP